MKKIIKVLSFLLVITLFATACGNKNAENNKKTENVAVEDNKDVKKIKVYTTIYPLYDFAKNIGQDKIDVTLMIPNGQEPHDWEPSNDDIKNLEGADIFVYNGANLESWTDKVIESLDNKALVAVNASDGIKLQEITEDGEKMTDPHTWLDPVNAVVEAKNIMNALVNKDPENADFYTQNFEAYSKKLEELNTNYADKLKDLKTNKIVVSHEAYGYLCKQYGLEQIGIEGINAENEPDAKTMSEIVDLVRKDNIKVIFTEDIVDPKVATTIADEAKVKTEFLNPLESLTDEEIANNADYISVMKANLDKLVGALK